MSPKAPESAPFNKGASVLDIEALGGSGESIAEWRKERGIIPSQQIRITRLVHMRYQHPDLDTITTFLQDFGMQVAHRTTDRIWYSGYGVDQYVYYAQAGPKKFLGGTFEVEEYDDLVKGSRLTGAGGITELTDAPGGGYLLTLHDAEGHPINLIHGQRLRTQTAQNIEPLVINYEVEKPRQRKFQRFEPGPAGVHKLGHYGLSVKDFDKQLDWYTRHFNFVPTDILYVSADNGEKTDVAVFAHIDLGETMVDHHTIFLSKGDTSHVHHCSFEVHDFDTQQLGHQWLAKKGYEQVWGIGRHILGSQIFDYWWDSTGNMIEHYADGDLVDHNTPIGRLPAGHASLAVWGPDVPTEFLE